MSRRSVLVGFHELIDSGNRLGRDYDLVPPPIRRILRITAVLLGLLGRHQCGLGVDTCQCDESAVSGVPIRPRAAMVEADNNRTRILILAAEHDMGIERHGDISLRIPLQHGRTGHIECRLRVQPGSTQAPSIARIVQNDHPLLVRCILNQCMEPETFASLIKHDTGSVRIISGRSESLGKLHIDGRPVVLELQADCAEMSGRELHVAVARQNERLRDPFGLSGMDILTRTSQRDQNPVVRIAVGVRFQREGLHDHQRILIVVGLARFVLVRLLRRQRSIQIDDHLPARRRSDVTLAEIHLRLADDILREKDLHVRDPDVVEGRLGRLFHIEAQRSEQMLEGNRRPAHEKRRSGSLGTHQVVDSLEDILLHIAVALSGTDRIGHFIAADTRRTGIRPRIHQHIVLIVVSNLAQIVLRPKRKGGFRTGRFRHERIADERIVIIRSRSCGRIPHHHLLRTVPRIRQRRMIQRHARTLSRCIERIDIHRQRSVVLRAVLLTGG